MFLLHLFILIGSCLLLFWSGSWLIRALVRIARYLGWREFVVAFVVMAFAGSLPNLFVGINAALNKIPQLSLGDIMGGNVVDLTLAVALAVLFSGAALPASGRMLQTSAVFTAGIALLPLILLFDGRLGRGDGMVLLLAFGFYIFWLFSKKQRFKKVYNNHHQTVITKFSLFLKDLVRIVFAAGFLLLAAEGVVKSSLHLSGSLNLSIPIIGILIVGLGNALPEIYFAVLSARKGHTQAVLGNLMGSVIVPATLVLGIVAIIHPIEVASFSLFAAARIFLVVSAVLFLIVIRSNKKITLKEALTLLLIYIIFIVIEILLK